MGLCSPTYIILRYVSNKWDIRLEFDKAASLAYNTLNKAADKIVKTYPLRQVCLSVTKITVSSCWEPDGYFLCSSFTKVIIAHIIITNVNKSAYVTMLPSPFKYSKRMA